MTTLGITLTLALITVLIYERARYGKPVSQGSSKANTLHAIESANGKAYQQDTTLVRLYDAVIADILDNE